MLSVLNSQVYSHTTRLLLVIRDVCMDESSYYSCFIGPQLNHIEAILSDIEWKTLAQQLKLNQMAAIHGACQNEMDPTPCKLREVVRRFINSQPLESCCDTVEKIATALEELTSPHILQASKLRLLLCDSEGIYMYIQSL